MLEVGNIMNITKQGEILISGTTRSNDGLFASKKDNTQENFLLKLNSDKSLAWILYYDGRINTILEKDGIIYTSGVSIDPAFENSSAWIRTYSSLNGILQNEKQFVGNGRDGLCQLALGENNIYLSISSESNNGVFSDNNGSQDIHILKLDYDLALQWSKSFGGSGRESSLSFSFDTSGNNLIACGSTFSQDGIVGPRNNISDAFIIKVDAKDGDLLWSKVLTNDMDDLFGMHAVGIDGSIYISSSWSDNPISFLADIVLLTKLQSEIELSSPNFFDIDIDVLPNPIKHIRELNIESKELFQKEVNLELVDVNGRILYNKNNVFFTAEKMSLDINLELVSGTYFLRIFNSASSITKRIIIATN